MRTKVTFLAGAAVGYVLGARAGRERYEQIKSQAMRFANDPRVKEKAQQASTAVRENAPAVKEKVTSAATNAKDAASDKLGRHEQNSTSAAAYPGT